MFDSVCLSHAMHPRLSERDLVNIGAYRPRGKTAYVINPASGESFPALMWQMQPNGVQYLSARFSLPRQRWGHNARLPKDTVDLFASLGIAADAIYKRTGIKFNPLTANVTDVHYAMDFYVGTNKVRPALKILETRQLPKYKRIRFDNGVEFKQKQSSIQIYGKQAEVMIQAENGHIRPEYLSDAVQASNGILRVEYRQQLPSVQRSQASRGLTRVASAVLTEEASHRIIADALAKLKFVEALEDAENDQVLDRLIEFHGLKAAMRLFGFLTTAKLYGADFWRVLPYEKRTYYDNLKLCISAGVWAIDE